MYKIFANGGPLMWILFIMSIIVTSVVIEKLIYMFKTEKKYHRNFKKNIIELISNNEISLAISESENEKNAIGRTIKEFLIRMDIKGDIHHFEKLAREIEYKELEGIERHLHLIGIISVVSPMIGLLGTVTGMIEAFNQMAIHGAGDPNLVAGGISKALVTTAAGLIVAIPSMIMYNLLTTKANQISEEIDKITTSVLNVIWR